jgi:integration host factor subunit beta
MVKSELIKNLHAKLKQQIATDSLDYNVVEESVNLILDTLADALAAGGRVEIRGFGSFCLHEIPAKLGRNPKTGERVDVPSKKTAHFKPGKEMRELVDHRLSTLS